MYDYIFSILFSDGSRSNEGTPSPPSLLDNLAASFSYSFIHSFHKSKERVKDSTRTLELA